MVGLVLGPRLRPQIIGPKERDSPNRQFSRRRGQLAVAGGSRTAPRDDSVLPTITIATPASSFTKFVGTTASLRLLNDVPTKTRLPDSRTLKSVPASHRIREAGADLDWPNRNGLRIM